MSKANMVIRRVVETKEGGYVNHPHDPGGETNFGITKRVADRYSDRLLAAGFNWSGKMIDLTIDMAVFIYRNEFWNKMWLDTIVGDNPDVAELIFDIGINVGVKRVIEWWQLVMNALSYRYTYFDKLVVDGIVGNKTISAFKSIYNIRGDVGITAIKRGLSSMQGHHYVMLGNSTKTTDYQSFTYGWLTSRMN